VGLVHHPQDGARGSPWNRRQVDSGQDRHLSDGRSSRPGTPEGEGSGRLRNLPSVCPPKPGTLLRSSARVCSPGLAILILILLAAANAAALIDENLPTDAWTYALIRELDLRGVRLATFGNQRPTALGEIAAALAALQSRPPAGRPRAGPERWLVDALRRELDVEIRTLRSPNVLAVGVWADGQFERDEDEENRWRGRARVEGALRLGSRTTLFHRSWVDTRPAGDTSIVVRPWKEDLAGVTDAAYLLRQSTHWRILIGRQRMDWGPGFHGGLLLSGRAPPLDMIEAEVRLSRFQGTAFTAVLDDYVGPYGDESIRAARYLSGHRLAWRVNPDLEISASEVIVYGGEGRLPEIRYVMPLFFFYGEQWNAGGDDNPLWAFDISWRVRAGTRLYGEYLIDDFQYETDAEPNEIGYMVGGEVADPPGLGGAVLGLEYARINRWTYGQNRPWNRYLHHGVCIGHPLGPDSDGLWVRLSRPLARVTRLRMEFGRVREGEGRIEDERSSVVSFPDRFPTGIVETRTTLKMALEVFPARNRWFLGEVGWTRSENFGHEEGRDRDDWTAAVRCRVGFEGFRIIK